MTNSGRYLRIIIPTSALSAINSLPKLNPFDWTAKLLADAAIRLVWSQGTTMIDRALAEDFASVFGVSVGEVPEDIVELREFITRYVQELVQRESLEDAILDLHCVTSNLNSLVISMIQSIYGKE